MRKRVAKTGISVNEKLMLTTAEVMDLLNLGRDAVYRLAKQKEGGIGSVMAEGCLRFPRVAVEAYVARLCREQGVEVDA